MLLKTSKSFSVTTKLPFVNLTLRTSSRVFLEQATGFDKFQVQTLGGPLSIDRMVMPATYLIPAGEIIFKTRSNYILPAKDGKFVHSGGYCIVSEFLYN